MNCWPRPQCTHATTTTTIGLDGRQTTLYARWPARSKANDDGQKGACGNTPEAKKKNNKIKTNKQAFVQSFAFSFTETNRKCLPTPRRHVLARPKKNKDDTIHGNSTAAPTTTSLVFPSVEFHARHLFFLSSFSPH